MVEQRNETALKLLKIHNTSTCPSGVNSEEIAVGYNYHTFLASSIFK